MHIVTSQRRRCQSPRSFLQTIGNSRDIRQDYFSREHDRSLICKNQSGGWLHLVTRIIAADGRPASSTSSASSSYFAASSVTPCRPPIEVAALVAYGPSADEASKLSFAVPPVLHLPSPDGGRTSASQPGQDPSQSSLQESAWRSDCRLHPRTHELQKTRTDDLH